MRKTHTELSRRSFVGGLAAASLAATSGCISSSGRAETGYRANVHRITGGGITSVRAKQSDSGSGFDIVFDLEHYPVPGSKTTVSTTEFDPNLLELHNPSGKLIGRKSFDALGLTTTFAEVGSSTPQRGFTAAVIATAGDVMGTATFDVLEENNA